ncbi:MAG: DUF4846 domain-containing protein [Alphaproteobacteria bacterium]
MTQPKKPSLSLCAGAMLAGAFALATTEAAMAERPVYSWLSDGAAGRDTIASRFAPPRGYTRVVARPGSFAAWLRHLPLKPAGTKVRLHDGRLKANQSVHAAVVDLDIGRRDLQQCADAVMRLRAEYLYSKRRFRAIAFNFTSGDRAAFSRWADGWRPRIEGRQVRWVRRGGRGTAYPNFRAYLVSVFTYAGSYSLARELKRVRNPADFRIGDAFVQGGFPGHAVIVVDMAVERATERKAFLLAQSFMPAQNLHVLKNPARSDGGAWYAVPAGTSLRTPEWTFALHHLRRF